VLTWWREGAQCAGVTPSHSVTRARAKGWAVRVSDTDKAAHTSKGPVSQVDTID